MLSWQAVAGALTYGVWVSDLTTGVNYLLVQTGITGTSFTVPGLTAGHRYHVWVRGVDADGGGPWGGAYFNVA